MLNKVILMGRLTKDPEMKSTQSGISIASFSIAVGRNFAKQGEERKTDFFNVTAFRERADFVGRYFRKGQLVAVSGSLQNRTWDDQNGVKHYATDVIAEEVHFAEAKRDNDGGAGGSQQSNSNGGDSGIPGFSPITGDDDLPF